MAISEKIQLLGGGLYKDIPSELTLKAIPTTAELEYVGAEDFDSVMLDKILPGAVEEKVNFRELLEIDYQWVCRCLRLINYGPYMTVPTVFCDACGQTSRGEYSVDLRSIACKPLPQGFVNKIKISKSEFISFNQDIVLNLPTIQEMLNAEKDELFNDVTGRFNRDLARMCYMIKSIGTNSSITPLEVKMTIQNKFEPADYMILKKLVTDSTDYGLRAGGVCTCPKCESKSAAFIALIGDRYFRTTLDDLRKWKNDRNQQTD